MYNNRSIDCEKWSVDSQDAFEFTLCRRLEEFRERTVLSDDKILSYQTLGQVR